MEAAGLGAFMLAACLACAALYHPASPLPRALPSEPARRALMGLAMGLTAIGIIYSPWGKQSGAHINPAVTLTFFRLGKVHPFDALFYVLAQFAGGLAGVLLARALLGGAISHPSVEWVVTVPGPQGAWAAFLAETAIAFAMMLMILSTSDHPSLRPYTGVFAGALVAAYVFFESPLSGFGMNPARTFASALPAGVWTAAWVYFLAPPLGMLLAAQAALACKAHHHLPCAKLHHHNETRCIHCGKPVELPNLKSQLPRTPNAQWGKGP